MSHRRGGTAGPAGGIELVVFAIVALIAAGTAVVWLAGHLASLTTGSVMLGLGLSDAARVLTRLPATIDDPVAAWPAGVRDQLPATPMLLICLAVAGVAVLAALMGVLWVLLRLQRTRRPEDGAEWGTARDLRALHVEGPERGRLIVGRLGRQLLAAERYASVMIVAPSQSGKTTGFAVPAILEWDGPVLATSVKGDLAHDTIAARTQIGATRVFDPTGATGLPTAAWSPVAASASWEGARRTAARLLELDQQQGGSSDERFWRPAAARYLAPLLFAASRARLTMGDVLAWIATTNDEDPRQLLEQMHADGVAGANTALQALQQIWEADPRTRSSMLVTAATALDAWQEPAVAAATGGPGAIDARWLLKGRNTLYLSAPADDQKRLRGLFTAIVAEVVAEAFTQATRTGKPIDPPLLLCLDEAANVAPLPNLDELASTGPGQGVQLVSVFQNISQIHDRWGRERAETIVANHRGRLFGSGIGDRATLEYVGAILGDQAIDKVSAHRDRLQLTELGSRTYAHEYRRLAAPNTLREAQPATALLVYGRLKPTWVALRPWYQDRKLTRKVNTRRCSPGGGSSTAAASAAHQSRPAACSSHRPVLRAPLLDDDAGDIAALRRHATPPSAREDASSASAAPVLVTAAGRRISRRSAALIGAVVAAAGAVTIAAVLVFGTGVPSTQAVSVRAALELPLQRASRATKQTLRTTAAQLRAQQLRTEQRRRQLRLKRRAQQRQALARQRAARRRRAVRRRATAAAAATTRPRPGTHRPEPVPRMQASPTTSPSRPQNEFPPPRTADEFPF